MYYFKKIKDDITHYHACSKKPPLLDGLIEISKEEYEAAMESLCQEANEDVLYS